MRILVEGDNSSAQAVRTGVGKAGIRLSDVAGMYGMYFRVIIEKSLGDDVVIDSVAGELESELVNCIARLTPTTIRLQRAGGIQNDREARVVVPIHDKTRQAIELGIVRAITRLTMNKAPVPLPDKEISRNNPVPDEFARELEEFHARLSTLETRVGDSMHKLGDSVEAVKQRIDLTDEQVRAHLDMLSKRIEGLAETFAGAMGEIEQKISELPKPPTMQEIESHIDSRKWYRRVLAYLSLALFCLPLQGQQLANTVTRIFAGAPTNPCTTFQIAKNSVNQHFYSCDPGTLTWVDIGPGSGSGSQHQVNGVNVTTNDPINFVDSASVTWANPSAGNIVATAVGGGFPRLDQVLDPNADKTFAMGTNTLHLQWAGSSIDFDGRPSSTATFGSVVVGGPGTSTDAIYSESRADSSSVSVSSVNGVESFAIISGANGTPFINAYQAQVSGDSGNSNADLAVNFFGYPPNLGTYTFTDWYGFRQDTTNATGITRAYGLGIGDITGAGTNYAIKTGLGQNSFGDITHGTRFSVSNATALVAGDFTLSAGWGNTASIGSIRGTDQAFSATITSNGTGIAATPTLALTFHDGTWTNVPVFVCKESNSNDIITDVTYVVTATGLTMTFLGTPTSGKTYEFSCIGMGI